MKRPSVIGAGLLLLLLVAGAGIYLIVDANKPTEKRGSADEEFDGRDPEAKKPAARRVPWPTYAYDKRRTHVAPYDHRPPFRRIWTRDALDTIEFPPSIGYGRVYLAQQKGDFFAFDAKTGKTRWRRDFKRCAASSPTIGRKPKLIYQSYMAFVNCPENEPGADGFLIAMDPRTGRTRWRFDAGPIESSPLLHKGLLYVGSWDRNVYAINARSGRKRWTFKGDEQFNTSPAYADGRIFIASDAGTLFALDARTGRKRWSAQSGARLGGREFFYATPTVAYGRVFIGNSDGTMYAYGARSGKLLWANPIGSYIYAAAAAYRKKIYTGTYDGKFFALDAATGDVKWERSVPAAVHSAPTVMKGVVYFATCSDCGREAARSVKRGPDGTFGVSARTGRTVWRFPAGKFASPVTADEKRIYLSGRSKVFGMVHGKPRPKRSAKRRRRRSERRGEQRSGRQAAPDPSDVQKR